ncbi:MAG TPA: hypothetical protein VLR89_00670, partial [Anaerolineaceae bacterium]|nr:hypothetical protein [Anaerolineaceae bacterium]
MNNKWAKSLCIVIAVLFLFLQACSTGFVARPESAGDNGEALNLSSPTPLPTYTPTPAPLGSLENPVVLGLIGSQDNQGQKLALDELLNLLHQS